MRTARTLRGVKQPKNIVEFDDLARVNFHPIVDNLNQLFMYANKRRIKGRSWIANNVIEIYKHHRICRSLRIGVKQMVDIEKLARDFLPCTIGEEIKEKHIQEELK